MRVSVVAVRVVVESRPDIAAVVVCALQHVVTVLAGAVVVVVRAVICVVGTVVLVDAVGVDFLMKVARVVSPRDSQARFLPASSSCTDSSSF